MSLLSISVGTSPLKSFFINIGSKREWSASWGRKQTEGDQESGNARKVFHSREFYMGTNLLKTIAFSLSKGSGTIDWRVTHGKNLDKNTRLQKMVLSKSIFYINLIQENVVWIKIHVLLLLLSLLSKYHLYTKRSARSGCRVAYMKFWQLPGVLSSCKYPALI